MIIDPLSASAFISGYTKLASQVCAGGNTSPERQISAVVAEARTKCSADASLISKARAELEARGERVDADVWQALESMQLKRWIYLRDTRSYSVFLDPSEEAAYAVVGLTQPVRDLIGGTGAVIETAVMRYRGRFVCDGIVSGIIAWLGANYRRDYNAYFAKIKARGGFHRSCTS